MCSPEAQKQTHDWLQRLENEIVKLNTGVPSLQPIVDAVQSIQKSVERQPSEFFLKSYQDGTNYLLDKKGFRNLFVISTVQFIMQMRGPGGQFNLTIPADIPTSTIFPTGTEFSTSGLGSTAVPVLFKATDDPQP